MLIIAYFPEQRKEVFIMNNYEKSKNFTNETSKDVDGADIKECDILREEIIDKITNCNNVKLLRYINSFIAEAIKLWS